MTTNEVLFEIITILKKLVNLLDFVSWQLDNLFYMILCIVGFIVVVGGVLYVQGRVLNKKLDELMGKER